MLDAETIELLGKFRKRLEELQANANEALKAMEKIEQSHQKAEVLGSNSTTLLGALPKIQRDIDDIVSADEYLARCKDCRRIKHTRFICPHCGSRQ